MASAHQRDQKMALRLAGFQLVTSLVLAGVLMLIKPAAAWAALAGSLTGVLASGCFAAVSLRSGEQASSARIVFDFYVGEVGKLVVIVVCMVAVFRYWPGIQEGFNALALFGAFLLTQAAYIVAPAFIEKGS